MTWISVDVEADGPIPGDFSMIALGAVVVADQDKTFLGYLRPISPKWDAESLAISGFTREETLGFPEASLTIIRFENWLQNFEPPYIFAADNNGFDWMFVCWYFHHFLQRNPFGFSSKNINGLFHGMKKDTRASFKGLRKTKHDHNPVNDAKGNAEALIYMRDEMGLKVRF